MQLKLRVSINGDTPKIDGLSHAKSYQNGCGLGIPPLQETSNHVHGDLYRFVLS